MGTGVRGKVARARGEVGPTPGITAAARAPGAPHPGHHGSRPRPRVRLSRPGVQAVTVVTVDLIGEVHGPCMDLERDRQHLDMIDASVPYERRATFSCHSTLV